MNRQFEQSIQKKFSIVTVCYNAKDVIEETIMSVISQNYDHFEYIIIDGNSTDGTQEIIKKYSKRIDIIVSEPDSGIYDAMNKGISFATGVYINFMNAGDTFIHENVLREIDDAIINQDADIIFGDEIKSYEWGRILKKGEYISSRRLQMPSGHQSTLVRTSLMKANPFDTSYKILADQNFIFSMYKKGKSFLYINVSIACYDMYGASNNVYLIFKEDARIRQIHGIAYMLGYVRAVFKMVVYKSLPRILIRAMQKKKYKKYLI